MAKPSAFQLRPALNAVAFMPARILWLVVAILLYALMGSPTPDSPGVIELLIGTFLVMSVGASGVLYILRARFSAAWVYAGYAVLLYGLTIPFVSGLAGGNDPVNMVRDVLPFLFFLLPLFFARDLSRMHNAPEEDDLYVRRILTGVIMFSGWMFAARVLFQQPGQGFFNMVPGTVFLSDPGYLANAPTVLFAGIMLAAGGGLLLLRHVAFVSFLKAVLCLVLMAVPFVTMMALMQRAYLGYFSLALLALALLALWYHPLRSVVLFMLLAVAVGVLWPVLSEVAESLLRKSTLVGLNMRWEEAAAVLDLLQHKPLALFCGYGWGAVFSSPAVGGVTINFTHSLLTTYLLKTGIIGLVLVLLYLFLLLKALVPLLFRQPVLAVALAGPLLINVFLYASFKSLDFGLMLFLLALWTAQTSPVGTRPLSGGDKDK